MSVAAPSLRSERVGRAAARSVNPARGQEGCALSPQRYRVAPPDSAHAQFEGLDAGEATLAMCALQPEVPCANRFRVGDETSTAHEPKLHGVCRE